MKQEFEMLQEEMDDIIQVNKDQMPIMKIGNVTTGMDLQEKINAYWVVLGDKYGFKHLTVEGSSRGKLFFLAEPKPIVIPKTQLLLIPTEKYDTIKKIVAAIEKSEFKNIAGPIETFIPFISLKNMIKK